MAFSYVSLVHWFTNADGTPASGKVVFSLTKAITNGSATILPGEVVAPLSGDGSIVQTLASNSDAATTPSDSQWTVEMKLLGAEPQTYTVTVPVGGARPGTRVDLGTLLPNEGDVPG